MGEIHNQPYRAKAPGPAHVDHEQAGVRHRGAILRKLENAGKYEILQKNGQKFTSSQKRRYMAYLIFVIFLHWQNFWKIKFTPKNANFRVKSVKIYTGQKNLH